MFWFIFIYLSIFLFHFFFLVVAVYSLAHCVLDSTANGSSLVSLGESSGLGGDVEKEHGYLFTPPWSSICFPPYHFSLGNLVPRLFGVFGQLIHLVKD